MIKISAIQFKRGIKSKLEEVLVGENKPLSGEPIFETDTNKLKIGDGINDYKDLDYIAGGGGGDTTKLVYDSIYKLPTVGNSDLIYVVKNGNTYRYENGVYTLEYVNNKQFYSLIYDDEGNIIGAERQINAGGANANYTIENFIKENN